MPCMSVYSWMRFNFLCADFIYYSFAKDIVVMEEAKVKYTDVGQRVTGDMIPKLTKFRYTDAVNGQALTQRQSMLLKKDILGNIFGESVIHHAAKISMIIILAGTLTWVCVPMLIGC